MISPVSITSIASLSALGVTSAEVSSAYSDGRARFFPFDFAPELSAPLTEAGRAGIEQLRHSDPKYKSLDDAVLFAIYVSREAVRSAGWKDGSFGINIGSSRGATGVFEAHHHEFITTGKTSPLASPVTTLGNISSWVAHDLGSDGPDISHSITCSTALHAVLNGIAWIGSGMADRFLVGGSEAPLTPFTLAQMKAMKIYSKENGEFACHALDFAKTANSMVLGEGAAVCCLEKGHNPSALAVLSGWGYATELLEHNASISAEATCFQRSMRMALADIDPASVDAIVLHAPGTIRGDKAEKAAIDHVFGKELPLLTGNKWMVGHTFGASGLLSLEMAVMMLRSNTFFNVPFLAQQQDRDINRVLVNAVGFGGNAVSLIVDRA